MNKMCNRPSSFKARNRHLERSWDDDKKQLVTPFLCWLRWTTMPFIPSPPHPHRLPQGHFGNKPKESRKDFWGPFAAAPKGRVSKSKVQRTFSFPFVSSSDLFLGLFSPLEQNPDSVPYTCERIITSVPSERQACCQRGGVWWGCKCS